MTSNLEDQIANAAREYGKARLKAQRSMDPEAKKKVKQAENLLEKVEKEASKTMDPNLKKKSDELFRKLQIMQNKSL